MSIIVSIRTEMVILKTGVKCRCVHGSHSLYLVSNSRRLVSIIIHDKYFHKISIFNKNTLTCFISKVKLYVRKNDIEYF